MKIFYFLSIFALITLIPRVSAAHFIVGVVNDAKDGTLADDRIVVLWNPVNGMDDNLTDVIGVNGNSGVSGIYMMDCELLDNGCNIGDEVRIKVSRNGSYASETVNLTVTGAGYDVAGNITLNSPPNVTFALVEDFLDNPEDEIDLNAGSNRSVICQAIAEDADGENSFKNMTARFFDNSSSGYGGLDDNNDHYTNNSCYLNVSYGNENQSQIICGFEVSYYANSGWWQCLINVEDDVSISDNNSDETFVNQLLSIGIPSIVDFGEGGVSLVSEELELNITNYGNVKINLSLEGYGANPYDGWAMNCSEGFLQNISIGYEKYNLTESNAGSLSLSEFENIYSNLTANTAVKNFDLDYQKEDDKLAENSTYWRVYIPLGIDGNCSGNLVFGATLAAGS